MFLLAEVTFIDVLFKCEKLHSICNGELNAAT